MTDVKLIQTLDDGNTIVENGVMEMDDGIYSAIYLSISGGNEDDPGESDTTNEWWGNDLETEEAAKYRSKTQHLIETLPTTTANLIRLKAAVLSDIEWMINDEIIINPVVTVSIPKVNWVKIVIETELVRYEYMKEWQVSA